MPLRPRHHRPKRPPTRLEQSVKVSLTETDAPSDPGDSGDHVYLLETPERAARGKAVP